MWPPSSKELYDSRQFYPLTDSVVLSLLLGLYLTIGPVLNYNKIESDQRDMVTNMRILIPARQKAHNISMQTCVPNSLSIGALSNPVSLATVQKSRGRLPDPRFLGYDGFLQTINMMSVTPRMWQYYTLNFCRFHPSSFLKLLRKAKLPEAYSVLKELQIYNTLPLKARPRFSYKYQVKLRYDEDGLQTIIHKLGVKVGILKEILVETRFETMDVPATYIEQDVSSTLYNGGKVTIKTVKDSSGNSVSCLKLFDVRSDCRQTVAVPVIHRVRAKRFEVVYVGNSSDYVAPTVVNLASGVSISVEVRDLQQPRPYSPPFGEFTIFFVGIAFLLVSLFTLIFWCYARFFVINRNVRLNNGEPPMFFQSLLKFRGW
ncbi:hypothetical protein GUITHDRAFT_104420 [Guillardia theta CCMP2712]|uniref:Uncharacterized protein n=1 Tax=Guillardia theta (strain CCMP2712) TaxID=905079 RepID=L1JNJ1_GUITC|nr:hypothetical protein GUITHDRAFT_104420 [Guillardia theta CCMP2712]EKX50022.1 hypothetical protein GUITHDRAFT_104420 [Guillardia theta CCMP2712]|eukprot:XP_005837002.1 hypothetical protein GUITHDRAFT_104420 [Guillardia theta CCMP2712]